MSVAMTNCGEFGWVSGARGYRYERTDPDSGRPWPRLPPRWRADARALAEKSGFMNFEPDACLVNRYAIGARMTAHQDRNEIDYTQPIVSVSLGLPATFAFHGAMRSGPARTVHLNGGDVLVWGGPARLDFHAVRAVKPGLHAVAGPYRYNITFRRAAA